MPVFIAALFPLSNHETNIRDAYQLINGLKRFAIHSGLLFGHKNEKTVIYDNLNKIRGHCAT